MAESNKETASPPSLEDEQEMERYGIIRIPVDYFHYGRYRYTNVRDAIAEAKRDQHVGKAV